VFAIFTSIAVAVAANRPGRAVTAPHGLDFTGADIVPFCSAAVGIFSADTVLDRGLVAAGSLVGCTAVAVPTAESAVFGAAFASFGTVTVAIAALVTTTTIARIPATGAGTVANVVVGPAAGIVGFAAGAYAVVSRTGVRRAGGAVSAAQLLDFLCTDSVPFGIAAIGIIGADAGLDGRAVATWSAVVLTAVAVPLAVSAVLRANHAVFITVAPAVTTGGAGITVV
jgi:hypothetical protein